MRKLVILAVLLLAVPPALAENGPYGIQSGVVYGFSEAGPGNAYTTLGPEFNDRPALLDGCAYSIIREDGERGRAQAYLHMGGALVSVEFANATRVLQRGVYDGTAFYGAPQHPPIYVEQALYGGGEMFVNEEPYVDQATQETQFEMSYLFARDGYRHEGLVVTESGVYAPGEPALLREDWEVHLRVSSAGGNSETIQSYQEPPDGTLPGRFTQNENYGASYRFSNLHFLGDGTADISFHTDAPLGNNELTFRAISPSGRVVANQTVTAAFGNDGSGQLQFPLDEFGEYTLDVTGAVTLSQYEINLRQASSEPFDLWFWWEDVVIGVDAWFQFDDCREYGGSINAEVTAVIDRLDPPGINLALIAMGFTGFVLAVMIGRRFYFQTVSSAKFKETMNKK